MVDVLINFKRRDRKHAERMEACLLATGHTVTCEPMPDFAFGFSFDLERQLQQARVILTIWSSASARSRSVCAAAHIGEEMRKMVPVRIDNSTPAAPFNVIHIAELSKWAGDCADPVWNNVLKRIGTILDGGGEELRVRPAPMPEEKPVRKKKFSLNPPPTRGRPRPVPVRERPPARPVPQRPTPNPIWDEADLEFAELDGSGSMHPDVRPRQRGILEGAVTAVLDMSNTMKAVFALLLLGVIAGAYYVSTLNFPYKDCADCPEMVVLTGGTGIIGSPLTEDGRDKDEGPQFIVSLKPFSISTREVTFAQWDACLADGGCRGYRPDDEGWGRDERPVINVSWHDAQAYVAWLRRKTGKAYRLLSETEWEYAARAGTQTPFSFGNKITDNDANFLDRIARRIGVGMVGKRTAAVGSYPPNAFGLFDMHGNVGEWVEDCYVESYRQTPADGSPLNTQPCESHIYRGGSWNSEGQFLRSANRHHWLANSRNNQVGFRVARDM